MRKFQLIIITILLTFTTCNKKEPANNCEGKVQPAVQFVFKEIIGDTAFTADTIFRDIYVQFQALNNYESVAWKLGSDPRIFTELEFSLSFVTALGTVPITFTGKKTPDILCFPGDIGI